MRYQGEDSEYDFLLKITIHGYRIIELRHQLFDDLSSGNEERALHCAVELVDIGFAKYAFKLLNRYAAKEVGVADPDAFVIVKSLAEGWEKDKASKARGGNADMHYLTLAVIYLARTSKTTATKDLTERVNRQRFRREFPAVEDSVKERAKAYMQRKVEENGR